jgi:hypothetical protein
MMSNKLANPTGASQANNWRCWQIMLPPCDEPVEARRHNNRTLQDIRRRQPLPIAKTGLTGSDLPKCPLLPERDKLLDLRIVRGSKPSGSTNQILNGVLLYSLCVRALHYTVPLLKVPSSNTRC